MEPSNPFRVTTAIAEGIARHVAALLPDPDFSAQQVLVGLCVAVSAIVGLMADQFPGGATALPVSVQRLWQAAEIVCTEARQANPPQTGERGH